MALNVTTFSAAVALTDTVVNVASATGITAPNYQVGDPIQGISSGITFLFCEQEMMRVTKVNGTFISVARGELGTQASAHGASAPVLAGLPTDFPAFTPAQQTDVPAYPVKFQGFSAPVASAATIAAPGPFFHVTGGTAVNIITPPAGMVEGEITIVFDSTCTWTSSAVTNGLAASGTSTTGKSAVTFYLDAGTSLWYPSRLA